MPVYDFRCPECGWIEEELVKHNTVFWHFDCKMKCTSKEPWERVVQGHLTQPNTRNKNSRGRFPHVSHMVEPCVYMTPEGPRPGKRRVVVKSLTHQEKKMAELGYAYYEENSDTITGRVPEMPAEIKRQETENPMVRKYLDMKKSGRIPEQMVLSEDELQERFHVPTS